jgi:hypothetical protein
MMPKNCEVTAKVKSGNCQGREGKYAISEISASLIDGGLKLWCVTSKCHRSINICEIPIRAMDDLAEGWLRKRGIFLHSTEGEVIRLKKKFVKLLDNVRSELDNDDND